MNTADLQTKISDLIKGRLPELETIRHDLHRIPELAGNEVKTSGYIRNLLAGLPGVEILSPFLKTDVVALLRGSGQGKCVTLRADIDALPVTELQNKPYASEHPGLMHACGHDGHAAMLLGAAMVLSQLREHFSGTIRFVFQPGEEGLCMAKDLVAAGALDNPATDFVFGIHNWPEVPHRVIGTRTGPLMASCVNIKAVVHGKGGHVSAPEYANNPLEGVAALILKVRQIRETIWQEGINASIAFGLMQGAQISNIIPEEAIVQGSCRVFDSETYDKIFSLLQKAITEIEQETGLKIELIIRNNYHVLNNDKEAVKIALQAAELASPWVNRGEILNKPMRASEDFCYYTEHCPGAFALLGYGSDKAPLHSKNYDFDDSLLPAGAAYLTFAALGALVSATSR